MSQSSASCCACAEPHLVVSEWAPEGHGGECALMSEQPMCLPLDAGGPYKRNELRHL